MTSHFARRNVQAKKIFKKPEYFKGREYFKVVQEDY